MTLDSLCGLEAPLDCRADWQRAVDQLREPDLEAAEDPVGLISRAAWEAAR